MKLVLLVVFPILFFVSLFLYYKSEISDGKLHVTICDVGQGDAIHIRTPNGQDILFDGGPDKRVMDCLFRSMPFWDRRVELVILSHPHADHLNGLIDVFEAYTVKQFVTEDVKNDTAGYKALEKAIERERVQRITVTAGDRLRTSDGLILRVLSPTEKFVERTSDKGYIKESGEFASLILLLSYHDFDMLLTGDTQAPQLLDAVRMRFRPSDGSGEKAANAPLPSIEVLQVPHHGSQTGLTASLVKTLDPEIATISVGRNNKYGHPSRLTLGLLSNQHVRIFRTDEEGAITIMSDGKSYSIK